MTDSDTTDVTALLRRVHRGDEVARSELLEVLYGELHFRAQRAMKDQPRDHTLQPTALVSEAYMRLVGERDEQWADRGHFLSVAARAMRQILVDHARAKRRDKRCQGKERVPLDHVVVTYETRALNLESLDDALTGLSEFDPKMAQAVEMRFFAGLTVQEVAEALGMSKRTFERRWQATRAWLLDAMSSR